MKGRITPRMEALLARHPSPADVEARRAPRTPRVQPMTPIRDIVWSVLARLLRGAR